MVDAQLHPLPSSSATFGKLHLDAVFFTRSSIGVALLLMAVLGWLVTATPVVDLATADSLVQAKLYAEWAKGNVVVMVRHAERCDRSPNTCLASPAGITVNGSQRAADVGTGLRHLGLANARLIASPLTRTQQTAQFISGHAVPSQAWLEGCERGFKDAVLAHKQPQENLVLITHSGCIDHFERELGVRAGQRDSGYTQAFFVKVDGKRAPSLIGSLDASDWDKLPH